jgi:succinoglycan biosynthesis transport protein ExoP
MRLRLLFAGLLGLVGGIPLALMLARYDAHIRTREDAESRFGMPVLAEIPYIPRRKRRKNEVITAIAPRSQVADAFRLLGAAITLPVESRDPQTLGAILVTSAAPGDGKSTVVANLAASLSELGKRVIVLSCDLHHPWVHRLLGLPNYMGLTEAMNASNGHVLEGHVWPTSVKGVWLVPSGPAPEKPGELLASAKMRQAIREARERADIVLVDTPPILLLSDATHLLPEVDGVVVVARAGQTTADEATETAELLKRFEARAIGIALNAVTEGGRKYYYQYYYGYGKGPGRNGRKNSRAWGVSPSRRSP